MPISPSTGSTTNIAGPGPAAAASNSAAMAMVTTLFFMWGFITCLNDILIPHLKSIFDLNYAQVMLVQFAFFSGYFIFALPAGKLIEWIGYHRTMVIGLCTMAGGALLFQPAASIPAFPFFLAALIILAAGMTLLQVSANPYVSVLGPPATASSRLNLTQAFNSLGTTIAPYFGSLLILSIAPKTLTEIRALAPDALQAYRLHEAATVKMPYLVIAGALLALAVVIGMFRLPHIRSVERDSDIHPETSVWKTRHLVFGVIGIFLYVGAEVSIGSFLVNYFSQPDIGGMTEKQAAVYVSFYWGAAMIGRFIGSAILQRLSSGKVLGFAAIAAFILVTTSMLGFGSLALWTIILVGLFNSVMFPGIFTLGIAGLGPLTGEASGLLIAAIVGGAIIPVAQGALADQIGIHHAFILPALCYVFIAWYGFSGSKPRMRQGPRESISPAAL
jgi:MFS transporter, FHS family, L-fucose permease